MKSWLLYVCILKTFASATLLDLKAGVERLNSDVIELRNAVEQAITNRCDSIEGCYKSSYDECRSKYTTDQYCPSLDELGYTIRDCGSGTRCNGLFDNSITTVRIPANEATGNNGNPEKIEVIEAVCYSRSAEEWMLNKYNEDKQLWNSLGVESPRMFFGSSGGVFRVFPASHSRVCGEYDPRIRPWYQALLPSTISNKANGRKVVIVMDTSRSMNAPLNENATKLSFMKDAVIATVRALSELASISVIQFGESAEVVGPLATDDPLLWVSAIPENKDRIISAITNIQVNGRSNVNSAIQFTFDLIRKNLISGEDTNECGLENIALLIFSDGDYTTMNISNDNIVDIFVSNVNDIETLGDYTLATFLYSIGNTNPNQVMKEISCAVDGYWTPVSDTSTPGEITGGYQTYFSTPMSTDDFFNYTHWSEPYVFTSSNSTGYTVSALVYNRDVDPNQFMGAVGMDISLEAAMNLYGSTSMEETQKVMNDIIINIRETEFNATCEQQRINLTYCETQSVRYLAGGIGAICFPTEIFNEQAATENATNTTENATAIENATITTENATIFRLLQSESLGDLALLNCSKAFLSPCPGYDEYPDDVWQNVIFQNKSSYTDRVCCEVGTNINSDQCPALEEKENLDDKISKAASELYETCLCVSILWNYSHHHHQFLVSYSVR